ncbi:flavin reductase family protein [Streptomyces sp. NPDC056405]|uniref:flavin reductase family protein n=1 Tax=Streptomyces sp. NPDC056405 TaxID=3345811 RepID=UPI0035D6D900
MPATTAAPPTPSSVPDTATFRTVLGQVPTAVSVVTAATPQGPVGVTVGSFTSVSLDPPLVVFYCGLHSASAAALVSAGAFCVNVLSEHQEAVCASFAGRTADRFACCTWHPAVNGAPRLDGAVAWIECSVENSFPAGDHLAVVGRVDRLAAAPGHDGPLVFHRGRLTRLDGTRDRHVPTQRFDWWDI